LDTIHIVDRAPPVQDFIAMRAACGWGLISEDIATRSLAAGLLSATLYDDARVIGCVRVVGAGMTLVVPHAP